MSEIDSRTASFEPQVRENQHGTDHHAPPHDALEPVIAELERRAYAETNRTLATARADAEAEVARAEREAAAITARARADGVARATAHATVVERRARRDERAKVLAAQRNAYDRWRDEVTAAVLRIRTEPGYAVLLDRLRDRAIALLGPHAEITEDPAGGLVAEAGGRRLDYRLTAIAAQALAGAEPSIGGLWS